MSPRSEREETLGALNKQIFAAMLDEIILDTAIQAHREVLRGRTVCQVCHTRCGSVHLPGSLSQSNGGGGGPSSRADTPSSTSATETGKAVGSANGSVNGTGTPGAKDGTVLLDCVICQRQIASNRYAPHLSSCMGFNTTRRGLARSSSGAGGKPKLPSDTGRSTSPVSETGNGSDVKGKGKGKQKRSESEASLKRKRPGSPQTSPTKVTKKAKASASPVSRVKAEPDSTGPLTTSHFPSSTTGSQSKIPSKLRESSTTSFLERSPSSASSRESSPAGTPASSAFSAATQSPSISARAIGNGVNRGRGKVAGTGPPARRVLSPPRPPPPMVHHVSVVPDYMIHDGGEETGSSTDTDSD